MTNQPGLLRDDIEPSAGIRPAARRRPHRILVAVLLLSLAGVLVFLVIAFQPLANAAGGCGDG